MYIGGQTRSQTKFPEGAKTLAMKSTRQNSNDGEVPYLKYRGCKAKDQRVQWDLHVVQVGFGHHGGIPKKFAKSN